MKPALKEPVCCLDWPRRLGRMKPPRAPISPIMPPATAVVIGQRRGTSWKVAPLPAPRAAKQSMKSRVVARSGGDDIEPKRADNENEETTERTERAARAVLVLPGPAIPMARPLYCLGNQPEPSERATPKLAPAIPRRTPMARTSW